MSTNKGLAGLLAPGDVSAIARELKITPGAAAAAIRRGHPGHKAVRLALEKAEASGALAAAEKLAKLTPVAQAA